jgi:mono/diheme cytochrome c family protein
MSRWSVTILTWCAVAVGFAAYARFDAPAVNAQSAPSPPRAARSQAATPPAAARPAVARSTAQTSAVDDGALRKATLDKYCITCHSARAKTGGVVLEAVDVNNVAARPELWEKVVRKMRDGAMPPVGQPRPDKAGYDTFASQLEAKLDSAKLNPGRPTVHRLNRVEYVNAMRDLLALDIDGAALLPVDESGYGFDNIADVLSVTPGLLERYMFAAQKISTMAVGDPSARPVITTYPVTAATVQDRRMSDNLPFRSRGGSVFQHYYPVDGEYVVKLKLRRAFSNAGTIGYNNKERLDVRLDGVQVKLFDVGGECPPAKMKEPQCVILPGVQTSSEYSIHLDDNLEVKIPVKAGRHEIGVSFAENSAAALEGAVNRFGSNLMAIDRIIIEGPLSVQGLSETPSRARIFVCRPTRPADEAACADKILSTLARRAYRRPVTPAEVQTLVSFYKSGRSEGADFDSGIQYAIERLLVSPNFLLRVERDPAGVTPGTTYKITNLELASRLSFFLWSSIPDDELLNVAAAGRLSTPRVLEAQVKRMLADPKADQLITSFASQWLYLRDLKKLVPDPALFPAFNDNLRQAFITETQMFLANEMREDKPVPDLLTAKYTFVNEQLARFYRYPNVFGTHFRRVEIEDPNRAGLLGQGSVLTVTSYATRTSVVQRGKYIMTNILGTPPPAPPPNVPALPEKGHGGVPATLRARMEQHRANPVCASCHSRMDPLGFALENFNAIGQWRELDAGSTIDPSGTFPDGMKFSGPAEFRQVLLSHRDQFVRTFAEKLTTYALGRGLEYYDQPAIRKILRGAAANDYRWSSVVLGIVNSAPFQMRNARESDPQAAPSIARVQ